ncbi:XRE family transcriptional regulator [Paenibacillus silviterrae]|uniref:XRE family transcriptional regulator n=1 Tax=Paenibacillus silviterrae TaxID=3242194 RepID=UPI002543C806|nr:XRE family transcriptional regulator [Paenibacillus chinjuensis]
MTFGQTLEKTMKANSETKIEVARMLHVDNSTIGKYTNGSRKVPKDVMRSSTQHYDDAELYVAAANEVTGNAWVPWLDGEGADLHKASVHLKTMEEVKEFIIAMEKVQITKRKDQLCERGHEEIKQAIMEGLEAMTALTHYIGVLCKEYCFSWLGMWKEHRRDLKSKKYIN